MVSALIFSYNRGLQLEVLLKSILQHGKGLLSVSILYDYSNDDHKMAYDKLVRHYPQFQWVQELPVKRRWVAPVFPLYWHNYYWWLRYPHNRYVTSKFRQQVLQILGNSCDEHVMFLTDDSMFFQDINFPVSAREQIRENPWHRSFSVRHGANLAGGNFVKENGLVRWNVYKKHDHPEWNYPFSVDGHIYQKEVIHTILEKVWFKNPNTMEGNVACYVNEKKIFSTIFSNYKSCLVGFELNRVQNVTANHHLNIDSSYLNSLFNSGYSLQIDFDASKNRYFRPLTFQVSARKNGHSIPILG
jgi:hypothetical protein